MERFHLCGVRRRGLLALAAGSLASGQVLGAASVQWRTRFVVSEQRLRQIHVDGPSGLLGIDADGSLWALSLVGDAPARIAAGLDPDSPLATGHGRIAARDAEGGLWIRERGAAHTVKRIGVSAHAGLLILPQGIIVAVVAGEGHRLVRLEPDGSSRWSEVARSAGAVMPDVRPLQVDLEGSGDGGHVVVLAGPDTERYRHGVLGDAVEATRLSYLERHSLQVIRELSIPAPFVIEDIAPRPVQLSRGMGLLTVRSGPAGAQLMLVAADPDRADRLRIEALGDALGTRHRWMAPTTNRHRWMAVHTPHIGGKLHEYRQDGQHLVGSAAGGDFSTHHIGSREVDLSVWLGQHLVLPNQEGRRLRVLDGRAAWTEVASVPLPARVVSTVSLPGNQTLAALLADGRVVVAGPLATS